MKISIKELKFMIFEASLQNIKNHILIESFGSFGGETGSDSIDAHRDRRFSSEDVNLKVQKLVNQAKKLKDQSEKEKDPRKSGRYRALSDELFDLAHELGTRYHQTRDPNIIYDVYKDFGFDPTKV